MGTKIKGIYKSFKFISQIFVKEREMEIGYPTDVKHVAHIGWDSQSANSPSWMNEFKTASDFSASSLSNLGESRDPSYMTAMSTWSSQDFEQSMAHQSASEIFKDSPSTELPKVPKKHKRKKTGSSPSSSSWRTSRAAKSRTSFGTTAHELEITPNIQEVIP